MSLSGCARGRARRVRAVLSAGLALLCSGCLVVPPAVERDSREGLVRADTAERAERVRAALVRLRPAVLELLPDAEPRTIEVWVQDVPALYEFNTTAYGDADGFFAEGHGRIHLRAGSEHVERTLAHELVHASLGPSWKLLPGTLEEGLCDYVSTVLCPEAAARLSAGRLASAAFATGGLVLEIDLAEPAQGERSGEHDVCWSARVRLEGEPRVRVDPFRVFDLEAGLSSTELGPAQKKAYYGIAFLLVRSIVENVGLAGLHGLCARAAAEGLAEVPAERLLEAAGLNLDRAGLRAAIESGFGPRELEELVRAHPEFLATTVAHYLAPRASTDDFLDELDGLEAFVAVSGPRTRGLAIASLSPFGPEVTAALRRTGAQRPPH